MINFGQVVINEKFEFAGTITDDVIIAKIKDNGNYKVIYEWMKYIECEDPFLKSLGGYLIAEERYEFELMRANFSSPEDMMGLIFHCKEGFSIHFKNIIYNPVIVQNVIRKNKDLLEFVI